MTRLPVVYILPEAKMKIDAYIASAKGEVSGLGKVEIVGNQVFLITEIYLFDQKCSMTKTEINRSDISKFMTKMAREGGNLSLTKLWWHSHAFLGVFWSKEDEHTIDGFNNDWMISLVSNKSGDIKVRIDVYKPIRVTMDDLQMRVLLTPDKSLLEMVEKEIEQKVFFKEEKPSVVYPKSPSVRKIRRRHL